MPLVAERQMEHIGQSQAMADHDHDMIHELSKRIDAVWRFDQYIANAQGDSELKEFWTKLKAQEQANVRRLKELIADHIDKDCF